MQQHEKFTNLITKENQREKGKARYATKVKSQ
jgi:hypothetical protein